MTITDINQIASLAVRRRFCRRILGAQDGGLMRRRLTPYHNVRAGEKKKDLRR
jgi:hypothetical protein